MKLSSNNVLKFQGDWFTFLITGPSGHNLVTIYFGNLTQTFTDVHTLMYVNITKLFNVHS